MTVRQATAGAPAILMRIGFTGELSYEIHVLWLWSARWQALMDAGAVYTAHWRRGAARTAGERAHHCGRIPTAHQSV